jgi:hypothetical protein
MSGLRAKILELAARPEGVAFTDIAKNDADILRVAQNMGKMRDKGQLILVGYREMRRGFTDQACADAYHARYLEEKQRRKRQLNAKRDKKVTAGRPSKPKATKAPRVYPKREQAMKAALKPHVDLARRGSALSGPLAKPKAAAPWTASTPIDYSRAKVTVCPSSPVFGLAAKLGLNA